MLFRAFAPVAVAASLLVASTATADDFAQDFREKQFDGRVLNPTDRHVLPYLNAERAGLRIKLPAQCSEKGTIGIDLMPHISGDFELTLSFDNLELSGDNSSGLALTLASTETFGGSLTISRGVQGGKPTFLVSVQSRTIPAISHATPARDGDKSGAMRVSRKGNAIQFSIAHGASTDFLQVTEVADQRSVYAVQFACDPKGCPGGITVHVTDFKASGVADLTPYLESDSRGLIWGAEAHGPNLMWWGAGAAAALGLVGSGFWWVKTRSEQNPRTPAKTALVRPTATVDTPVRAAEPQLQQLSASERAGVRLKEMIASMRPGGAAATAASALAAHPPAPSITPTSAHADSDTAHVDQSRTEAELPHANSAHTPRDHSIPGSHHHAPAPTLAAQSTADDDSSTPPDHEVQATPAPLAAAESKPAEWDDGPVVELEKMAYEFVKLNPGALSFGKRNQFRFHFQNDRLHGRFVAWWETDPEAIKAMGVKGKELEDRLPKKLEGNYENGDRHGTFQYWDRNGNTVIVEYLQGIAGMPYAPELPQADAVPADSPSVEPSPHAPEQATLPTVVEGTEESSKSAAPIWDEAGLKELEAKAIDFLKVNPGAVSYGERHHFRFHFQDAQLHGRFHAWWQADIEAIKAMGIHGKEIEDRLQMRYEGAYDAGQRHGRFTYSDPQGHIMHMDFNHGVPHGGSTDAGTPGASAEPPAGDEVTAESSRTLPEHWNEAALCELEERARDFLEENPDVHTYVERHRFRFHVVNGELHGSFVAWRPVDAETLKSFGTDRKEIEERLPKTFVGNYESGRRHGVFTFWNEQGRVCRVEFRDGVPQV